MPRRDAISEKKERLALEHEQLQKLMFQARSSVRRSPLDEHAAAHQNPYDATETKTHPEQVLIDETPAANIPVQMNEPILSHGEIGEDDAETASTPLEEPPREPYILSKKGRSITVVLPDDRASANIIKRAQPIENTLPQHPKPAEANVVEAELAAQPVRSKLAPYRAEKRKHITRRNRPIVLLLVAALLAGFGAYYLYTRTGSNTDAIAINSNEAPVPAPQKPVIVADSSLSNAIDKVPDEPKNTGENTTTLPTATTEVKATSKPVTKQKPTLPSVSNTGLGQYKVISKAYFHNEPDESTRRKAFIIHWNNAVLTPQEEQNGFVYIVFTNHLGQTSKGWLLKKDLRPLN